MDFPPIPDELGPHPLLSPAIARRSASCRTSTRRLSSWTARPGRRWSTTTSSRNPSIPTIERRSGPPEPPRPKRVAATRGKGWRGQHSWFLRTGGQPRLDWDTVKLDIMRRGNQAKYAQNPDLAAALLATGEAELVENSRGEPFWGVGRDGRGPNWAGQILMEIRAALAGARRVDETILRCRRSVRWPFTSVTPRP